MLPRLTECQLKLVIAQGVADAILKKNRAKEAHDGEAKQDGRTLLQALTEARTTEHLVVAELNEHRKGHGC
jgi:hypothetical protein